MAYSILIVEDEPPIRELLCDFLVEEGYRVDTVGDGLTALTALADEGYDLVISDIAIPGLGGRELARAIHADRDLRGTPVVLMSATETAAAGGVPCAAFISKPFEIADMLDTIEHVLGASGPATGGSVSLCV